MIRHGHRSMQWAKREYPEPIGRVQYDRGVPLCSIETKGRL